MTKEPTLYWWSAAWRLVIACAIAIVAVLSVPDTGRAAQEPPPAAGASPESGQPPVGPAQLQELFDSYVMLQAQRQLKLSNDQLAPFLLRLKALQAARRRADNQRLRIVQELRRLTQTDDKIDEAQVRDRLKMLDDVEANSAAEIKQALASLDQVLDVRQQARFRVLEVQMERNKVELLMRARQQALRRRTQ
jgi:hypothetical protein